MKFPYFRANNSDANIYYIGIHAHRFHSDLGSSVAIENTATPWTPTPPVDYGYKWHGYSGTGVVLGRNAGATG